MIEAEEKRIRRVYYLLLAAVTVSVCSQLVAFLMSSMEYLIGIGIAVVIAGLRYFYLHKKGADTIEKIFTFFMILMAVLGPLIFILFKWLVMGESLFNLELLMAALFILPITLMLYGIFLIRGVLPAKS